MSNIGMTKQELLDELNAIFERQNIYKSGSQISDDHIDADYLLLKYVNDPEIVDAFTRIHRYYA
jgi:hypothetical protein